MKLAYKGFDENLKCRNIQFEIGITYRTECKGVPRLCSSDGFHYCEKLESIKNYYNGSGIRYCLIAVLGPFSSDSDKSITTAFRIIREITDIRFNSHAIELVLLEESGVNYDSRKLYRDAIEQELIHKMEEKKGNELLKQQLRVEIEAENKLKALDVEIKLAIALHLQEVRKFQEEYPLSIIGGSVALFLHGIRLDRWYEGNSDFDVIIPYYIPFQNNKNIEFNESDEGFSGSTFDNSYVVTINGHFIKMDVRIDNKESYELVEYEGFTYKVNSLENIWEAKIKYSKQPGKAKFKHRQDLEEAMGVDKWREELKTRKTGKVEEKVTKSSDLPWD